MSATTEKKIRRSFTEAQWDAIADAVQYHYLGGSLYSYGVAEEDLSEEEAETRATLKSVADRLEA